jgi:hypothetical protein
MRHLHQQDDPAAAIKQPLARRTVVVADSFAQRARRLQAVRDGAHGTQVLLFEQLAARLAGGFCRPVDHDSLRAALRQVLPLAPLGELDSIKRLPGMMDAAAATLGKAWDAGIDLQARAAAHPRLAALARLERDVVAALPAGMLTPPALAATALARIAHARAVLGSVHLDSVGALAPCWRPLLLALADNGPVAWTSASWPLPDSIAHHAHISRQRAPAQAPAIAVVSAANAAHEAIEAMRWVRGLLASGAAQPHDIALAAASPAVFDDHLLALRQDAGLDLHFVHGVAVVTTRAGQACAALADILCNGLTHARLRRLAALCRRERGALADFPDGWLTVLPRDRDLVSAAEWTRVLNRIESDQWPDGNDCLPALRAIVTLLQGGPGAAETAGETLLSGAALGIWRQALLAGPAAALPRTLANQKQGDGLDGSTCVAWMPAAALASTPRRFVRLLGMNAGLWPRDSAEDGLLPDHVVPARELDPLPPAVADVSAWQAIVHSTGAQLVLSHARRDSKGRALGASMLLHGQPAATHLRRNDAPAQPFSDTDRLQARPAEWDALPQAQSAQACWLSRNNAAITAHDGLVQANHPVLAAMAARTHSASSLKILLRNPLRYVWKYALGWGARDTSADQLTLDSRNFGNLVHELLERAVLTLQTSGSLAAARPAARQAAVAAAVDVVARTWPEQQAVPPQLVWQATLARAGAMAEAALAVPESLLAGARSYVEVPFGGSPVRVEGAALPWDAALPIVIPGTTLQIRGYIDRVDIAADGASVHVCDYKTGMPPKQAPVLDGGKELQRCLYAFVVQALVGAHTTVQASLLYPVDGQNLVLDQPGVVMADLADYIGRAYASLVAGHCVPGPDTGDTYDEFALLLPANAAAVYCQYKADAASALLGDAAAIWSVQ